MQKTKVIHNSPPADLPEAREPDLFGMVVGTYTQWPKGHEAFVYLSLRKDIAPFLEEKNPYQSLETPTRCAMGKRTT